MLSVLTKAVRPPPRPQGRDVGNRRLTAMIAVMLAAVVSLTGTHGEASPLQAAKAEPRVSATITRNLVRDYGGVSGDTINRAIQDAKTHFGAHPNDRYVITIPAGVFNVAKTINVSGIGARNASGRLVIQGAGKAKTILVTDPAQIGIRGRDTYHVSFVGIHFTLPDYTVSQGHVVSATSDEVVIDVPRGFPTPFTIMNDRWLACHERDPENFKTTCGPMRRYMRRYEDSRTDPRIVEKNNRQLPWVMSTPIAGVEGRWKIALGRSQRGAPYTVGDLVGLKSKEAANTYFLCGGSDFEFKDIRWTQRSRGVFRCGFDRVRISGTEILRSAPINGQVPVLSSPAGGPQIGQPGEPTGNNIVENNVFVATGDNSIGVFSNDGTTVIRGNRIYNSFARGIFLIDSPKVQLSGNALVRSPLVYR